MLSLVNKEEVMIKFTELQVQIGLRLNARTNGDIISLVKARTAQKCLFKNALRRLEKNIKLRKMDEYTEKIFLIKHSVEELGLLNLDLITDKEYNKFLYSAIADLRYKQER